MESEWEISELICKKCGISMLQRVNWKGKGSPPIKYQCKCHKVKSESQNTGRGLICG